jgi:hypothetical protein
VPCGRRISDSARIAKATLKPLWPLRRWTATPTSRISGVEVVDRCVRLPAPLRVSVVITDDEAAGKGHGSAAVLGELMELFH